MAMTTSPRGLARRDLLRRMFWLAGAASTPQWLTACGNSDPSGLPGGTGASPFADLGPLGEPDANGIRLPAGYSARIVAVTGEAPAPGATPWPAFPDGSAVFARPDGGWIRVTNSEIPGVGSLSFLFPQLSAIPGLDALIGLAGEFVPGLAGVNALVFAADGTVVDSYRVLSGTTFNCAGGATPWNTWLSCEEINDGQVWECDPFGVEAAVAKPALGIFAHEALAVDAANRTIYMTEDLPDGRFYRFIADAADWPEGGRARLESGRLQVMAVQGDAATSEGNPLPVVWLDVLDATRRQVGQRVPGSTAFDGGEGIWLHAGIVYFATKGDNRVWAYDTASSRLEIIYDFATATGDDRVLSGVDNLTVTPSGDILVAEDGGDMQLCVIRPDRSVRPLLQITGQDGSEISGPSFSPDGRRLYINSNRGGRRGPGLGITYEILLPFSILG